MTCADEVLGKGEVGVSCLRRSAPCKRSSCRTRPPRLRGLLIFRGRVAGTLEQPRSNRSQPSSTALSTGNAGPVAGHGYSVRAGHAAVVQSRRGSRRAGDGWCCGGHIPAAGDAPVVDVRTVRVTRPTASAARGIFAFLVPPLSIRIPGSGRGRVHRGQGGVPGERGDVVAAGTGRVRRPLARPE